jgi:DNA polymerase-3 subunit gamma/tau
MSTEVLALKYRPRNLEEVIGQPVATRMIRNGFKGDSLHNGYIIAGKFGCGKTTLGRIIMAMDNCSEGKKLEPCGKCQNCIDIFAGKHVDCKEIDAASAGSIENVRNLAKELRYSPVNCRVKYLLLDEAHRLSGAAGDAALKMIEEPPEGVRFILCTTDPHLLKDTVHSRCVTLRVHQVGWGELAQHITKIAQLEGIEIDENAIKIAARTADGSVRNALTNLQTLVNYCGGEPITSDEAKASLGVIDERMYFQLTDAICGGNEKKINPPQGMLAIQELLKDGKSGKEVVDGLFQHVRNLLVSKTCNSNSESLVAFGFTEEDVKRYENQAKTVGVATLLQMTKLLKEVSAGLRLNLDGQNLLETYMLDCIIWNKTAEAKAKAAAQKAKTGA